MSPRHPENPPRRITGPIRCARPHKANFVAHLIAPRTTNTITIIIIRPIRTQERKLRLVSSSSGLGRRGTSSDSSLLPRRNQTRHVTTSSDGASTGPPVVVGEEANLLIGKITPSWPAPQTFGSLPFACFNQQGAVLLVAEATEAAKLGKAAPKAEWKSAK